MRFFGSGHGRNVYLVMIMMMIMMINIIIIRATCSVVSSVTITTYNRHRRCNNNVSHEYIRIRRTCDYV